MRHSRWSRIFSATLAIWLAAVLAEPVALHVCPMHDGGSHAGHDASVDDHAAAGHAAGSGGAGHVHVASHDAGEPEPAQHPCACVGHCAGTSTAGLPVAAARVPAPSWVLEAAPIVAHLDVAPATADHVLPFANGPPPLS